MMERKAFHQNKTEEIMKNKTMLRAFHIACLPFGVAYTAVINVVNGTAQIAFSAPVKDPEFKEALKAAKCVSSTITKAINRSLKGSIKFCLDGSFNIQEDSKNILKDEDLFNLIKSASFIAKQQLSDEEIQELVQQHKDNIELGQKFTDFIFDENAAQDDVMQSINWN